MKPLIRPLGARGVRLFKVYVMKVVLLSTLLLASLSARAELIEAQGSAAILGGDEIYAREQATRDALRQALLASGASVSSIQRLENGSLRSEQIQIRSGGDIRQYRLKREEVRNGRMYITLVADIQAERQICQTQHYAKDLTLVRLRMRYPDQASTGDPRRPILDRYPTGDDYLGRVGEVAAQLERDRFILAEDISLMIETARKRSYWP